jgi:hypothetical protein
MDYSLTTIRVRPGTLPPAVKKLGEWLAERTEAAILACWYSEIGVQNQILLIAPETPHAGAAREQNARDDDPFGLGDSIIGWEADVYTSFDFIEPLRRGNYGPYFEVRSYLLKPGGLNFTIEAWRKALPERSKLSPAIAAMYAASGTALRFVHIWPYDSLEARQRVRAEAVATGVWPPPGGPTRLVAQQVDIYLPAQFSPIR